MPTNVGREDLQRLVAEGAQLVEVLPKEEFDEQHLRGAIHIPLRKIDTGVRASLAPERPVIVYSLRPKPTSRVAAREPRVRPGFRLHSGQVGLASGWTPDRRRGCRPTDCRDGRAQGGADVPSRGLPPGRSGTSSNSWVGHLRRRQ